MFFVNAPIRQLPFAFASDSGILMSFRLMVLGLDRSTHRASLVPITGQRHEASQRTRQELAELLRQTCERVLKRRATRWRESNRATATSRPCEKLLG